MMLVNKWMSVAVIVIITGGYLPAKARSPQPLKADEKKGPTYLGAGSKHDGKTLAEWITTLADVDDVVRDQAAYAIAQYGPNAKAAVPKLILLLKNPMNLSFASALKAISAIGPAAGDAVDPLVPLLNAKDALVRVIVAYTLSDLGSAAAKSVPHMIVALNDAKVGTEENRHSIQYSIERLGKHNIQAVYAAVRQDKLKGIAFGNVIRSLGPDDTYAVAGLVEELNRREADPTTDNWAIYTMSGLKQIGPKAAPALPELKILLKHKNEIMRKCASEAIMAIEASGEKQPLSDKTSAVPDAAVGAVFGKESSVYKETGYKGVSFVTSFDDLAKDKGLEWTSLGQPWAFCPTQDGAEEFVFNADKKLVCYTRSYNGGPDDYLDQFAELFGKSERKPRVFVTTSSVAVTRRTLFDYTFPKVLGRVVFAKSARQGPGGGLKTIVEEQTHVAVIDRAWAATILDSNAKGKREVIKWLVAVGQKVKNGEVVLKDLPKLDGAEGREFQVRVPVQFFDTRREEANKNREKGRQPPPIATVEKTIRFGDREKKPVIRVNFTFDRYSPLATSKVYQQDAIQKGAFFPKTGNNALDYTPFGNLITELNVALMSDAFPPKEGQIDYVRPEDGPAYYEWRAEEGWVVRCGANDSVTIEWVGKKAL